MLIIWELILCVPDFNQIVGGRFMVSLFGVAADFTSLVNYIMN